MEEFNLQGKRYSGIEENKTDIEAEFEEISRVSC
jgi:hypothetical protein